MATAELPKGTEFEELVAAVFQCVPPYLVIFPQPYSSLLLPVRGERTGEAGTQIAPILDQLKPRFRINGGRWYTSRMRVEMPDPVFSPWYRWDQRSEYPLSGWPGVYLIAINDQDDLHGQTPDFADIVYIGETLRRLVDRWYEFYQTLKGKRGHSGAKTIRNELGTYDTWENLHLYVSGMGVECKTKNPAPRDYRLMGSVLYLEYDAFAKYSEEVGGHPRFNKQ